MKTAAKSHQVGYLWLLLLGVSLVVCARQSIVNIIREPEFPVGCDPFGYLLMAKEFRAAEAAHRLPDFSLKSDTGQILIDSLKASGLPESEWDLAISPGASLYFPKSGKTGLQYPPGTGLLLSLFPEGHAVHLLSIISVCAMLLAALAAIAISAARRTFIAAGFFCLAIQFGIDTIGHIAFSSYSINATYLPLLLSVILIYLAIKKSKLSYVSALAGGLCFGVAFCCRLPVLLLLPGMLVPFVLARNKRSLILILIGTTLAGVLPIMLNQARLTGSPFRPTYSRIDSGAPTLHDIPPAFKYYFLRPSGRTRSWVIYVIAIGLVGYAGIYKKKQSLDRLIVASAVIWALPAAYFLTHGILVDYYVLPGLFACSLFVGTGLMFIERPPASAASIFKILAFLPSVACVVIPFTNPKVTGPITEALPMHFQIPADLSDPKARIWSDSYSGTLWYYGHIPAFKIGFATPRARTAMYQIANQSNDPQYMILDGDEMKGLLDETVHAGAKIEDRGMIEGKRYYKIDWPPP